MTQDKQTALTEAADLSVSTIKAYVYLLPSGSYYVTSSDPTMIAHVFVASAVKGRICGQHRGCQPGKVCVR